MTYEEFKYQVRKLGLHFWVLNEVIKVGNVKQGDVNSLILHNDEFEEVCNIYTKERFSFYQTREFYNLDECLQHKLFILVFELARTSLDERGDLYKEKRWYLKHKYLNKWVGKNYLKRDKTGTCLSLGHKADEILFTSKFTKDEIEELKEQININDFKMEEVE